MKQSKRYLALLLGLVMLLAALTACGRKNSDVQPIESTAPEESAQVPEESAEAPEVSAKPERENGERFEDVIMIEGMEETIKLEHVVNETAGFEIDYDYEGFVRQSDADRERFVWNYDDPENPENYLEVVSSADDAETVAAAVSEKLSADYEVIRETITLDGAGECIRLDASAVPGGANTADVLQAVYIIPAADGCIVATVRYLPEGSDGFGKMLSYMVNTILVAAPQN